MRKILVIEDETILRKEVMRWLSLEDYEVVGTGDGLEGIKLAFSEAPHLILCDIALPQRNGYEIMLEIRSHPQTQLTPFIYMTARASHEDIRKGMGLGADDYITKPFTRLELLEAVRAVLEKRDLQEQHHQFELGQWQEALKHEQEQRIFKAKLIGMFSHDFRNPLASILSSSGILRNYRDRLDEQQQITHYNRIETSVNRLLQMLDDMLIVAQLDTGNLSFKPELLDISSFIQEIIADFQATYGESHAISFHSNFEQSVSLDSRLLRQIAYNLISNALKYSSSGTEILVSLDTEDGMLLFTVADSGIGIPEAEQGKLFTAFQRASNVGKIAGTGLGLAIVKEAVDLHGGNIELRSQLGIGTTISVVLPIRG